MYFVQLCDFKGGPELSIPLIRRVAKQVVYTFATQGGTSILNLIDIRVLVLIALLLLPCSLCTFEVWAVIEKLYEM